MKILTAFAALVICLIIAHYYNSEWLLFISIGFFGVMIINEFIYRQQPADDGTVNTRLNLIITKLDDIMTREERLQQAIENLNAGTNEIAADLQKLKDEIAAGNVSEESLTALEDNIAVLQQLGTQQ